jgi:hypothetical protein
MISISEVGDKIVRIFRQSQITPYKTGNLKFNAITAIPISDNAIEIVIGGKRAPYAVFLQYGEFAGRSKVIPNKHKRFIDRILESEIVPMLRSLRDD